MTAAFLILAAVIILEDAGIHLSPGALISLASVAASNVILDLFLHRNPDR